MDTFFSNFSQLHFLRPEMFYLLIPLALFWLLKLKASDNTQWHQVIPPHLAKVLLATGQQKVKQNRWLIPALWFIVVAAMAGPTWQKIEKPVFQVKRASVIVMDMSMSMRATDLKPNRLAKAKFKAIDLANAIEDGEIALVAYAGDAFTISPLTPDSKNIVSLIPSLSPEIMPEPGSYPLLGLSKATELLEQAGFVKGDIYWFTDGVEPEDVDELNQFIGQTRYTINVMAFGTAEGAPIQMLDKSLLKDGSGSIVIPKLNTAQLAQLATVGNGVFVRTTASDLDIQTLLTDHDFDRGEESQEQQTDDKLLTGDDWQEAGPYLILLVLPFVLYAFRRGVTLSIFAVFLLSTTPETYANDSPDNQVEAAQVVEKPWTDFVFNTKDQVASSEFNQGNFAQAQATFENQQWKGSSAYKAGDYEAALNYFEKDGSATGLYNQGNALAQLNKLDEAIKAYDQALKQNPDHQAARANKELLEKLKQQNDQQQQSQDQQQEQSQDQQGGQDQQQQDSEQQQNSQNNQQDSEQDQQSESSQEQSQQDTQQQNQSDSQPEPTAQDQQESESKQEQQQGQNSEQESEAEQQSEQQAQQQESEQEPQQQGEQQAAQLTPEQLAEQEAQQKLEQLLRKVSDDPSVLLRNKMILESRKRQQFARPPKGAVKSW